MRRHASPHTGGSSSYRGGYNAPSPNTATAGAGIAPSTSATTAASAQASTSTLASAPRLAALTPATLLSLAALPLADDVKVAWMRYTAPAASASATTAAEQASSDATAPQELLLAYAALLQFAHEERLAASATASASAPAAPTPTPTSVPPTASTLLSGMLTSLEWELLPSHSTTPAPPQGASISDTPRKSSTSTPSRSKRKASTSSLLDTSASASASHSAAPRRRLKAVWGFVVRQDETFEASTMLKAADAASTKPSLQHASLAKCLMEGGAFTLAELWSGASTAKAGSTLLSAADTTPNEEFAKVQMYFCNAVARKAVLAWSGWCAARAGEAQRTEERQSKTPESVAPKVGVEVEIEEGEDEEATMAASAGGAKSSLHDHAVPLGPTTLLLLPNPKARRRNGTATATSTTNETTGLSIRVTLTPGALLLHARPTHLSLHALDVAKAARGTSVVLAPSGREAKFVELRHASLGEGAMGMDEARLAVRTALQMRGVCLPTSFEWALCVGADAAVPIEEGGGSIEASSEAFLYPVPLLFQRRPSLISSLSLSTPRLVKGLAGQRTTPTSFSLVASTMVEQIQLARKVLADAQGRKGEHGTGVESKAAKGTLKTPVAFEEKLELPRSEDVRKTEKQGDGYAKDEEGEEEGSASDSDVPMALGVGVAAQVGAEEEKEGEEEEEEQGNVTGDTEGADRDLWGELFAGGAEDGEVDVQGGGDASVGVASPPDVDAEIAPEPRVRHLRRGTMGDDDAFGYDGADGFGLLTEDDFSFFDDAAAAAAAADNANVAANKAQAGVAQRNLADAMDVDVEQPVTNVAAAATSSSDSSSHTRPDSAGAAATEQGQHSGAEMDPPSLPGFTPSSFFSASSPAFGGGLVGKTPRTPFSPGQELADHAIAVVGAEPSLSGLYQLNGPLGTMGAAGAEVRMRTTNQHMQENVPVPSATSAAAAAARPRAATALDALSQQQRMREVGSKYEGGKFAVLPSTFGARTDEAEANGAAANGAAGAATAQGKNGKLLRASASRATLRRQASRITTAHEWRPPTSAFSADELPSAAHLTKRGSGYTALALPAIHKLRLLDRARGMAAGADEELMSEMDTVEGTVSEMSEGDDSDDSEEEELREQAEREERIRKAEERTMMMLRMATQVVEAHDAGAQALQLAKAVVPTATAPATPRRDSGAAPASPTDSDESSFADLIPEDEEERDRRWAVLVGWLACNPQMRLVATAASESEQRFKAQASAARASAAHSAATLRFLTHLIDGATPSLASFLGEAAPGTAKQARIEVLEPPHVLVGCQGVITRFEPSALRFWDKLALSAAGGPRRVTSFVLCIESSPPEWVADVTTWLARVEQTFASLGLGTHTMAKDHVLALAGNVGIAQSIEDVSGDAETWNDTLQSLVSRMKGSIAADRHVVLYAVGKPVNPIPFHAFVRLQEGLRAVATRRFGLAGLHIVVRPVPSMFVCEATRTSGALAGIAELDIRRFAISVYDDLRVAVGPTGPCPPSHEVARVPDGVTSLVQYPAFTLDAPRSGSARLPRFELKWPFAVYNVLERGAMLHVAYDMRVGASSSATNEAVLVSVIDERAQAHHVTCWRSKGDVEEDVCAVWEVALEQASRVSVDLRIVVCKSGAMTREELRAWSEIAVANSRIDLTIMCADTSSPLAFAGPHALGRESLAAAALKDAQLRAPPATGAMSGAVMLDGSQSAYALYPKHRLPISSLDDVADAGPHHDAATGSNARAPLLSLTSSLTVRLSSSTDGSTRITPAVDGAMHHASSAAGLDAGGAPHLLWLHMLAVHIPSSSLSVNAPASSSINSAVTTPADLATPSAAPTPASSSLTLTPHQAEANDTPEARMRDITRSYAALEFIGRGRFALDNSLPWPLGVLAAVKPGLKACQ